MPSLRPPSEMVIIYMRCRPAEHPYASWDQQTDIREHLDRLKIPHGHAHVITDVTNAAMKRRPGYIKIVELCDRERPIVLAIQSLARLGRLEHIMWLVRRIVELGGRVISVEERIDTRQWGWDIPLLYRIERREYFAARRAWREGCD